MKKALTLFLVLAMAAGMLAGCSDPQNETPDQPDQTSEPAASDPSATEPSVGEPPASPDEVPIDEEQYFNTTLGSEPPSLNELLDTSTYCNVILNNVVEPLVRNEYGEIVPAGCSDYRISEDGLTYTFTLRENYWDDGEPVTAEHYAYTVRMRLLPETGYPYAADMYVIKNGEAVNKGEKDVSELGVRVVDERTLEITLEYVCPALLSTIRFTPLRQDVIEKWGDRYGTEAETLACCGPFVLDEWVHNSSLTLVKNERYWDADTVKLEKATYHIVAEEIARYNMLDNGSLDTLDVSEQDYIDHFSSREDLVSRKYTSARHHTMGFNLADEVFSNRSIRLAVSLAFPREGTSSYIWGDLTTPAYGYLPPPMYENNVSIREASGDPFKQMIADNPDPQAVLIQGLQELGLSSDPADFSFELYVSGTSARVHTMGEYWQQELQNALGCTVTLRYDDWAIFYDNCCAGDYQMGYISWGSPGADASYMFNLFTTASGAYPAFYNNPEFDELALAVQQELDPEKRLEMFIELDNMLVCEDVVICPNVYAGGINFSYDYVNGVDTSTFTTAGLKYVYTAGRES